jgi:hypothetical protein
MKVNERKKRMRAKKTEGKKTEGKKNGRQKIIRTEKQKLPSCL